MMASNVVPVISAGLLVFLTLLVPVLLMGWSLRAKLFAALWLFLFAAALVAGTIYTRPLERSPEAQTVIRVNLAPEAMRACAEAFVRYGFFDVRDYECRLEMRGDVIVVALYGPGEDGKTVRMGDIPLSK